MHGQCGELVTFVGHQCITLIVDICIQHGGREAPRRGGMSSAAETCSYSCAAVDKISTDIVDHTGPV